MKCETKAEAQRVAYFGMKKMQREGNYTLEATRVKNGFLVRKDGGDTYGVVVEGKHPACSCPFYAENASFEVCKHIYWVREELAKYADFRSLCESLGLHGDGV